MRGVGALALLVVFPAMCAGCGGRSNRHGASADGGSGAFAGAGPGGTALGDAGGRASVGASGAEAAGAAGVALGGGGAGGSSVMSGNERPGGPVSGPPSAGAGGFVQGGSPSGGAGGDVSSAGAAGTSCKATASTYAAPTSANVWRFEGGDATSFLSPAVLAVDDEAIVAAASSDPAQAGVAAFDTGIVSEAFVMRVSHAGALRWSRPLKAAGLPFEVVRTGDDVLVIAQSSPELARPDSTFTPRDVYLAKVALDGTLRYEKAIPFAGGTWAYTLAVAPSGDFYFAGGLPTGGVLLVKCDADANVLWLKTYAGSGAVPYGLTLLSSGDLVMTGEFADVTFDGCPRLKTTAVPPVPYGGFVARFTPEGSCVWNQAFGGGSYAQGFAVAALSDDGFLLAGSNALDLKLGGSTTPGVPFVASDTNPFPTSQSFVARLDRDGKALWLVEPDDILSGSTDSRVVAVTTDGTNNALVAGRAQSEKGPPYLRSFDLETGVAKQLFSAYTNRVFQSTSVSVAPCGDVWVAGSFDTSVRFSDDTALSANGYSGEFLLRLEPQ
jgi:hypothetical protein